MSRSLLKESWSDCPLVAFDTETSGQYPLAAEICEVAAVKWLGGKKVGSYQQLIKPKETMSPEVIAIHGITNEMVADAPPVAEILPEFLEFIQGSVLLAHHAAFDLGFLAVDIEDLGENLPDHAVVCTSLLSRQVIDRSPNHRLQTLVKYLGIEQGTAHRALDDSVACLEVGLECFRRIGDSSTIQEIIERQGKTLTWERFSMANLLEEERFRRLIAACRERAVVKITYGGGSKKGLPRFVEAMGIVRSLDGDYLVGFCQQESKKKRYYLNRILNVEAPSPREL